MYETRIEKGYVPIGLDQQRIWDEDFDAISMESIYSGTVQLRGEANKYCGKNLKGDIECDTDKTTHGYWAKDHDEKYGTVDETLFTKKILDFHNNNILVSEYPLYLKNSKRYSGVYRSTSKDFGKTWSPGIVSIESWVYDLNNIPEEQCYNARASKINGFAIKPTLVVCTKSFDGNKQFE